MRRNCTESASTDRTATRCSAADTGPTYALLITNYGSIKTGSGPIKKLSNLKQNKSCLFFSSPSYQCLLSHPLENTRIHTEPLNFSSIVLIYDCAGLLAILACMTVFGFNYYCTVIFMRICRAVCALRAKLLAAIWDVGEVNLMRANCSWHTNGYKWPNRLSLTRNNIR